MKKTLVVVTDLGCLKAFRLENHHPNHAPHLELVEEVNNADAHDKLVDKVTDLGWAWSTNGVEASNLQTVEGKKLVEHMRVESLQSCSACHR